MHIPSSNIPSTGLAATILPLASPPAAHASTSTNIARSSSPANTSRRDISEDDSFPSGSAAPESSLPSAPLPINLSAGAKNTDNLSRLLKLTLTRHEGVPKIQKRFDNKTADLAELMAKAQEGTEAVEAQLNSLTKVAEMTRQQSDRMMQEALKTREFAERLYAEAEQVKLDVQKAKEQTKDASKHSEDLFVFSRRLFVWLHELFVREGPLIEALRQEMEKLTEAEAEAAEEWKRRKAEAAAAAEARRVAEEQRLAAEKQRLAAEAEEKTRQAEEERRRAAEAAFEAQRAREQRRLAEEERLKEEKDKEYQAKRAAVQASKQRAREAEAAQIRLAREQDQRSKSGSASMDVSPERAENDKIRLPSNTTPSVATPKPTPAPVPRIIVPTTIAAPPASKSPTGLVSPHASLPPRPPPAVIAQAHKNESKNAETSSQKTRKVSAMPFVPAQTEAGRQVNTDMPFGSTELARESLARKKDLAPPVKTGQTSRSPSTQKANAQRNAQSQGQPKKAKKVASGNVERGSATLVPASGFTHPLQHSKMSADHAGLPLARGEPSLIPNSTYAAQISQPLPPVIPQPSNATASYPDIPVTNGWAPEIYRDPHPDNLGGDGGWGDWGVSPPPVQSICPEPSTSHHTNGQHVGMRRVSDTERYRRPPGDHYSPPPPDHRGAPYSRKRGWDGPQYEDDRISPPRQRARVSPEYDHGLDHRRDPRPSRFDRSPSPVPATYSRADYSPYSDRDYDRRGLTPYDYLLVDSYHPEDYPEGYGPQPVHPSEYDTYHPLSSGTSPGLSPNSSYGANGWLNDNDLGFDEPLVVDGSPTALHHRSLESRMGDPPQPGSSNRRGGSGNNNQNNRRGSAQTSNSRGRGQGQGRGRGPANRGRDQNAAKPSLANRIQRSLKDRVEKD
ncbi:hypothetical protein EWM64_g7018 [Hericium alpestre]|uniref:RING-type E3 ubiquitin transferase n=1 Tax=Hericium alpestre TaxID=135208 RepID=A0A4Y9ZSH9_9AGAM|nr:hypothetical protein EWM64_g7018 [Hericium alpestre]